ncbi:ethanolamine utilization protein EutH [Escherichia albertii]|uniref:ethanolamine utilization protein EutH n=1 Tax=Escherichia albertii TaxID=208962 RepID=UPI000DE36CD7|nr:ethanolamine utilization protein EutH [Escherichia albertii]
MGINEIIMYIMMFFMLIAAVDRILSQFGGLTRFLGKFGKSIEGAGGQFEEGFMAMGALGLAMVGMTALAPVLAHVLGPVIIVAVLVALGLKFIPEKMINGFQIFAKFLVALITIGLAAAVVKFLLGWELIPGLDPIFMAPGDKPGEVMRAIEVIGSISCVLLGAYPMVLLLTRWFEKPLMNVGKLLNVNNIAAAGMVATLANNIPMFGMMKQMDARGKVINCAFAVSAAFALGDHLGFAAANMNAMIFPMIVGKLIGGVTAIGVAMMLVPKDDAAQVKTEVEAQS